MCPSIRKKHIILPFQRHFSISDAQTVARSIHKHTNILTIIYLSNSSHILSTLFSQNSFRYMFALLILMSITLKHSFVFPSLNHFRQPSGRILQLYHPIHQCSLQLHLLCSSTLKLRYLSTFFICFIFLNFQIISFFPKHLSLTF